MWTFRLASRALVLPAASPLAWDLSRRRRRGGTEPARGGDWNTWRRPLVACEEAPEGHRPVAVVGDVFVDVVAKVQSLPVWDADTEAEYVKVLPGGSALNQARHLWALGAGVRFFGARGGDAFGTALATHVGGQGFSLEHVRIFPELPTSVCLVLAGPADRAFVSCYSTTDAFGTADLEARAEALLGCRHLHIGGYFNLKGLQNPEFTALVQRCRTAGMTVSLNTQYDAGESWTGLGGHLRELLALTDVLFVNGVEASRIAGALLPEHEGVDSLCRAFPKLTLVVTQGERGCQILRDGMPALCMPTSPLETVVDATGAGDAFLAGFLSLWLAPGRGAGAGALRAAAARGHAAARVCLAREGACVTPVGLGDLA